MADKSLVKDVMVAITDFPHIPYWFSLRQAITIMKLSKLEKGQSPVRVILVFDEKYQLLGHLRAEDILRGLEPRYLSQGAKGFEWASAGNEELAALWSDPKASKEAADSPVKDAMAPVKATVKVTDPITRAACLLIETGAPVLAAMDGNKIAGIVRLDDVFDVITSTVTGL